MSDKSLFPDLIKSASDAAQANIPETVQQTDSAISSIVGFFNNVVLYPVKKANLTFKYKLENFENDLKEKLKDVPEENLQEPPVSVAGPALEALRYTYDEEELREMYENLLASAMDTRKVSQTHPAFVDAIKQMSPLDAKIMKIISERRQLRCARIRFQIKNTDKEYSNGMPDYFVAELSTIENPFIVSSSITNLARLGIVDVIDGTIRGQDYESLKTDPYVVKRFEEFKEFGNEIELKMSPKVLTINNYGNNFASVCLSEEIVHAD